MAGYVGYLSVAGETADARAAGDVRACKITGRSESGGFIGWCGVWVYGLEVGV